MKYKVSIEQDEDGKFVAKCSALPGCISEGTNREEVIMNIKDAIEGYLASLKKHNEPRSRLPLKRRKRKPLRAHLWMSTASRGPLKWRP
jgi:predicted RNase H-like HicB family nuclease